MEDSRKVINTTKSSTEVNQTVISIAEEKSVFERAIIEAYKQKQSSQIYEKLAIALDEIKFMVSEIKKTHTTDTPKYLLNRNVIDKLSRIVERKFFNVNILVAKILENLLDSNNFEILSNDINLLINFSNEVLNLLEDIKSTIVSFQLEKKCSSFLNYLLNLEGLNEEQRGIINELLAGFPTRNSSIISKNFDEIRDKILRLCKNQNVEEKLEGINQLMENFGNTSSLEEQFDLLIDKVTSIVKAVIHQPNPEYKEAYFQLGNFICSILFATKFKVDAFLPDYRINLKEINRNYFLLFAGDELVEESTKQHLSFLHNTVFELTAQKEILLKCENIFLVCNLILNTLSIYDTIFDLQFVCYIILKRIYFTFPQFRRNIEDLLAVTLVNLCLFKDPFEVENSEECKLFLAYLMKYGEEELKRKINKRLEGRDINIEISDEVLLAEVEFEYLKLSDFNLRIGYPSSQEIEAGGQMSKYIEVYHPNSMIYIGFATHSNDITFHLLKYVPNDEVDVTIHKTEEADTESDDANEDSDEYTDKGHFKELITLDRTDSSLNPVKVVLFVPEPGTYKIVFDNTFSWFTAKTLRYRISVLKPVSEIDLERRVDFGKLGKEKKGNAGTSNFIESNASEIELTEDRTHMQKILMVKIEGDNKAYNVGKIYKSEKAIKDFKYMTVPVLVTKDSIRIYRTYTNEHGQTVEDYREKQLQQDQQLSALFEEELTDYFASITDFDRKTIFLSTFIFDKQVEHADKAIPITNDERYKQIHNKLGFFPEQLLAKFTNVSFFLHSMADACLLYTLYEKIKADEKVGNIIHIHFDKYRVQSSLYFEGVINDKISGLNYDFNKTLVENVDNVIDFVNKIIVIFGGFDLSVSFSDVDEKVFELFAEELNTKLAMLETQITLERKSRKFLDDVLNAVHLFQMAD